MMMMTMMMTRMIDETYHPSQDYNDSQIDPDFRPTRRELREADKEGDS